MSSPEQIKITRSDAKSHDVSKVTDEIHKNKNETANTLNNYKSLPLDNDINSNHANDTINIRRSDKVNHDVRELSVKAPITKQQQPKR
jgi:hypothetical protein